MAEAAAPQPGVTLPELHGIVPGVMRTTCVLALAMLPIGASIGCRTRFEAVVCESDADCTAEEYFCDTAQTRCVRRMCKESADCAEVYGYTCDVATQRCVLPLDGGPDGTPSCDRDGDGVDGEQCGGDDCDDDDDTRFPGNSETCNAIDDDCDESTSDGTDADFDDFCFEGGPLPCCAQAEVDCCDTDADAKPGQTAWFTMDDGETACGGWNYNCFGGEEEEVTAGLLCSCDPCTGTDGWELVVPGCGGSGTYALCGGLSCGACPLTETPRQQGCH